MNRESLKVNEIFFSIQGESTHAGRPCVFVRLAGCHLRWAWCDTQYAFYAGRRMRVEEVIAAVAGYRCRLVEITGGEPLIQPAVFPLMAGLADRDFSVMVETSGAADLSAVDRRVVKIMDLKCPASGESHRNRWSNLERLAPCDEVKFVIADRGDYEWARAVVTERELAARVNAVLFSCAFGLLAPAELASWILADRLPVRLQLQMHKHIWGPDARGV